MPNLKQIAKEHATHEGPRDRGPESLPDLVPLDLVRKRAAVVVAKPLHSPQSLLGREEASGRGSVVEQVPDSGRPDDSGESNDEEEDFGR